MSCSPSLDQRPCAELHAEVDPALHALSASGVPTKYLSGTYPPISRFSSQLSISTSGLPDPPLRSQARSQFHSPRAM
eukprot:11741520-Alexandrium_andersonii.AAC.1